MKLLTVPFVCLALLGACYSPSIDDCQYACGVSLDPEDGPACPEGMFCNAESLCVSVEGTPCGGPPIDSGMPPDDTFEGPMDAFVPDDGGMTPVDAAPVDGAVTGPAPPPVIDELDPSSIRETPDDVTFDPSERESGQ